jgi:two-component system phosphate regulon sensor histidine kinase PhoR
MRTGQLGMLLALCRAIGVVTLAAGLLVCARTEHPGAGAAVAAAGALAAWASGRARRRHELAPVSELLVRIGEGDIAARARMPVETESSRVMRAALRAQRGFAEALARAEDERDELRATLGALGTGLLSLDAQRRVRSTNAAAERILGISGAVSRGRLLAECVRDPELLSFVEDSFASAGREEVWPRTPGEHPLSGSPRPAELQLHGAGAAAVMVAAEPLRRADGRIDGMIILIEDVTRLRRLESMRTDFAANVSHELRTPITNIKGYAETLQEVGFADAPQAQRFVEVIQRNAQRLAALVEDILLLSFLEQPGHAEQIERHPIQVDDVIAEVVEELAPPAAARRVSVHVGDPSHLIIMADRRLALQAVGNLVSNAVKFSAEGSSVRVRVIGERGFAEIAVADEGPGIPERHLPRIFERFYRVDKARSREQGGTGLGLSIVKHVARVHGGSVHAESVVGRGSTFRLLLPLAKTSENT